MVSEKDGLLMGLKRWFNFRQKEMVYFGTERDCLRLGRKTWFALGQQVTLNFYYKLQKYFYFLKKII